MQSNDTPIDEIDEVDEAFLAEALADLDIPDSEHEDDAFVHISVDDVLAMSDPMSSFSSRLPHKQTASSPSLGSRLHGDSVSSSSRKSNSRSSSRSSRSKANGMDVVGTVESSSIRSEDGILNTDFDNGAAENRIQHSDSTHRDLRADFDEDAKELPEPSPSTPLVDDDLDSIYIEEIPSRTPVFDESSGAYAALAWMTPRSRAASRAPTPKKSPKTPLTPRTPPERVSFFDFLAEESGDEDTTPVQPQRPHKRDAFSKSSPNVLEEAAKVIGSAQGASSAEHGEASVGSRTLKANALNANTQQEAPNAADTSLIMTDEDFLAEMAGFGAEESGHEDGFEGENDYRGEGAATNGVPPHGSGSGDDLDPHDQHSDSELLLMEEETAERARRVRQLASTRAKSSTSTASGGSGQNRELSRSIPSAPGRSKTPQRGRLSIDTDLSSFGGGQVDGGVLYSDDELLNGRASGSETPNGTLGRSVSNGKRSAGIVEFSQELAHMHDELEATRSAYNKSNNNNDHLHSTISILQNEKQALLDTISQLDAKIVDTKRASEEEIEKHRKAYDDLSSESVVFRGRIELLETENLRFRDKDKILRDQFQNEVELAKGYREQLDGLQQDHDDLLVRFEQVVKDYETVSDDFDRLKSVATSQLQNAGELYSERVRELNQTRSELSEITSQRDTTRLELVNAVNNLNSQQALRNKFQERAQHFEEVNQQLEHERESLHEKLSESRRTADQTSSELQSAMQLKEQFMNELIEQKEEAGRLRDQVDDQESGRGRAAELEDSMAGLAAENRALKSRLFDDSETIRKMQGENGELLSYVDQLLKESNR